MLFGLLAGVGMIVLLCFTVLWFGPALKALCGIGGKGSNSRSSPTLPNVPSAVSGNGATLAQPRLDMFAPAPSNTPPLPFSHTRPSGAASSDRDAAGAPGSTRNRVGSSGPSHRDASGSQGGSQGGSQRGSGEQLGRAGRGGGSGTASTFSQRERKDTPPVDLALAAGAGTVSMTEHLFVEAPVRVTMNL